MALFDQLSRQITGVRVETSVLPDIIINDPFAPGPPSPLLQYLRPRITLEIAHGDIKPVVIAPYGDPTSGEGVELWPAVLNVLSVVALGALGFVLYRRLRARRA